MNNLNKTTLLEDIQSFAKDFPLANKLNNKTIAITGATGLLGSCMVYCLQSLYTYNRINLHIIAIVRNKQKAIEMFGQEGEELSFYEYDFSSDKRLTITKKVDFLFHFASPTASKSFITQPVETMNTVYQGTQEVLRFAKEYHLESVVFASTLEIYGTIEDDSHTIMEHCQGYLNPLDIRSSYPLAKRAAEGLCHNYAQEYHLPVKIARLAQTFGAGVTKTDNRVFAQFARSILNGQDIILHTKGELCRCYCYTIDAISAMLYVLLKGTNGEAYNVANEGTYISIFNMAQFVAKTFNPKNVSVLIQPLEEQGYSPTTKLRLNTSKIQALGWKPKYSLHDMFSRLIASLKE